MEYILIEVIIPVFTILVSILIGVYTVHSRIKNENKESHKPYLVLKDLIRVDKPSKYSFYLNIYGKNTIRDEKNEELFLNCRLGNIGYGVASNIKFYDLVSACQIEGTQLRIKEQDQKLYTTFDIANNYEKTVDMLCNYDLTNKEMLEQDKTILLCVYQDLNENYYDFILIINYKEGNHFDYYAFQRTSKSYKNLMKNYKENYKKIMDKYKSL